MENNAPSGNKTAVGIIILIVIIGGVWLLLSSKGSAPATTGGNGNEIATTTENTGNVATTTTATTTAATGGITSTKAMTVITLTDKGFSPQSAEIKTGDTVKWVNETNAEMWVASAKHPTHTIYAGTSLKEHCPDSAGVALDQCKVGNEYTFTFAKTGSWGYHNHKNASQTGMVVVK